jgi:hypothetical protein
MLLYRQQALKACEKFKLLSNNWSAKKRISTSNMQSIFQKNLVVANKSPNVSLPEFQIWSDISQSISLQKCTFIQIADILSLFFLHKYLLPKCQKKSQKAWKLSVKCLYICKTFAKQKKKVYRPIDNHRQLVYRVASLSHKMVSLIWIKLLTQHQIHVFTQFDSWNSSILWWHQRLYTIHYI